MPGQLIEPAAGARLVALRARAEACSPAEPKATTIRPASAVATITTARDHHWRPSVNSRATALGLVDPDARSAAGGAVKMRHNPLSWAHASR